MADTNFIKTHIEPAVLRMLQERFGQPFAKQFLRVGRKADGKPRLHEFDAVSKDGSIVAGIRSSTGLTSGGRHPAGKTQGAFKEIYVLRLVKAQSRFLVVTDPEYKKYLDHAFDGILPPRTQIISIGLPKNLQDQVSKLRGTTD